MLFPKIPPAPTMILSLADLRTPNEFDWALLAQEGVRQGPVTIRGASILPETKRVPLAEPAPAPMRTEPRAVPVERLPAPSRPVESEPSADASLLYAGLLTISVCVAALVGMLLAVIL